MHVGRQPSKQSLHQWQHPLLCTTADLHQLMWSCRPCVREHLTHRMSLQGGEHTG